MKKKVKLILALLIIIIFSISLTNRYVYGTWNVFSYPNRLTYGNYRYDKGIVVNFTNESKPKYEISSIIDRLTGKRVYSTTKDYLGCGKAVYLYLGNNKFLILGSGGGG